MSLKTTPFIRSQEGNQHQKKVQRLHHRWHNSGARWRLKQGCQQVQKNYPTVHLPHGFCCLCPGQVRFCWPVQSSFMCDCKCTIEQWGKRKKNLPSLCCPTALVLRLIFPCCPQPWYSFKLLIKYQHWDMSDLSSLYLVNAA